MSKDEELKNTEEEVEEGDQHEGEENQSFKAIVIELLQTFVIGLLLCIFLKGTIAEARFIPSKSMEPTLKINDRILVQKVTRYFGNEFNRGDVVVFYPPAIETGIAKEKEQHIGRYIPFTPEIPPAFIKRVVGLPGDQIVVRANQGVWVNGEKLDEPYILENPRYDLTNLDSIGGVNMQGQEIRPYAGNYSPIVVPDGHLFVLGDNRNGSADSHVWGFIPQERIAGKMCLVFWKDAWIGR